MELQCDTRVLSKAGILLFTQRHLNCFFITILPGEGNLCRIALEPKKSSEPLPSSADLQNELLECEFIASRYAETRALREDVERRILHAATPEEPNHE